MSYGIDIQTTSLGTLFWYGDLRVEKQAPNLISLDFTRRASGVSVTFIGEDLDECVEKALAYLDRIWEIEERNLAGYSDEEHIESLLIDAEERGFEAGWERGLDAGSRQSSGLAVAAEPFETTQAEAFDLPTVTLPIRLKVVE